MNKEIEKTVICVGFMGDPVCLGERSGELKWVTFPATYGSLDHVACSSFGGSFPSSKAIRHLPCFNMIYCTHSEGKYRFS